MKKGEDSNSLSQLCFNSLPGEGAGCWTRSCVAWSKVGRKSPLGHRCCKLLGHRGLPSNPTAGNGLKIRLFIFILLRKTVLCFGHLQVTALQTVGSLSITSFFVGKKLLTKLLPENIHFQFLKFLIFQSFTFFLLWLHHFESIF